MSDLRLLILSQYFPPEMGAPQARLSELAECLIDRGWSVEALTALPNYPTGRVFPGYRSWMPVVEQVGRVRSIRVPLFAAKTGFTRRLASYLSFVASSSLFGPVFCSPPSLLLVESPPLFVGWAARLLSLRWGVPYVFNVSDLWPESAIRMGVLKRGSISAWLERFEVGCYLRSAGVTGQTQEIIESVRRRALRIPVEVITNGVDPLRFGRGRETQAARELLGAAPGPIFIYAGLLGWAQGLGQVLDLARVLPPQVPGRFVLVGDGPERELIERRIRAENLERVTLLRAQPRQSIPSLLAASDAAVITLGMRLPGAVPSKIYEAMASQLPILLVAEGEAAQRIERANCGIAVTPGDAVGLGKAFERLATQPELRARLGAAGRRAAEGEYDRRVIADRLDRFLRRCLGHKSP